MKRIVLMALAALLLLCALVVLAENNTKEAAPMAENSAPEATQTAEPDANEQDIYTLGGEVTEVGEDYFVIKDAELGEVQVNFGDDSLFEGVEADELAAGQYVFVLYDGKMTRSLPPQVFALRVSMYTVSGEITGMEDGRATLVRDEIGDEVILTLPQDAPQLSAGDRVTAYTNGMMTMSLPPQMIAVKVIKE